MLFEIKHKLTLKVLFSCELDVSFKTKTKNQQLGETIKRAYLQGANLRGADLREADLQGANLQEADLQEAYLQEADLQGANLRGADLRGADLRGAYLQEAKLREADLQGANLRRANLRGADLQEAKNILSISTEIWSVYITNTHIQIGCKYYTHKEWFKFTDEQIQEMDSAALSWWNTYKKIIKQLAETLNKELK